MVSYKEWGQKNHQGKNQFGQAEGHGMRALPQEAHTTSW